MNSDRIHSHPITQRSYDGINHIPRTGSAHCYLYPHRGDIEDFLDLRINQAAHLISGSTVDVTEDKEEKNNDTDEIFPDPS